MILARLAVLFTVPAALVAVAPATAADLRSPQARPSSAIERRVYFTPATPLDQIPLYSLDPASPDAMRGLEAELARLYTHTTSLPSGPDRRAFQTRIYLLEKRLRPLDKAFDAQVWIEVRTAVRQEWEAVQASLPAASTGAPVADAGRTAEKADRS